MKARNPKSFEGLLQEKLAAHQVVPPPNLWSKIERETSPNKLRFLAKRLNTRLHWLNLAATILLLVVVLFFLFEPQKRLKLPVPKFNHRFSPHFKAKADSLDSLKIKTKQGHETNQ